MAAPPDTPSLLAWVPRLRRYARVLCARPEDADDLVQDTLERAWARASLWPGVTDMRAWLFGVMHHLHVDHHRRGGIDTTPLDDALPAPADDASHTLLLDLEGALLRLAPDQREVLVLVAVEEMTYAEVAQALSLPLGTVMSRLFRARERLRVLMDMGDSATPPSAGTHLKRVK